MFEGLIYFEQTTSNTKFVLDFHFVKEVAPLKLSDFAYFYLLENNEKLHTDWRRQTANTFPTF